MLISTRCIRDFISNLIKKSGKDSNAQNAKPKTVILNGLTSDDASFNSLGLLVIVTLIVDRKRVIILLNSLATLGLATLYTNTFGCSFKCWFDAERKKINTTLETYSTGSLESLSFKKRVGKINFKIHSEKPFIDLN